MNALFVLATTAWLAGAEPMVVNGPAVEGPSCGCGGGGASAYVEGEMEMPMTGSYRSYSSSNSRSSRPSLFARLKGMFSRDSEPAGSYEGMEYSSGCAESAPAKGTFVEASPANAGQVIRPVPQSVSAPMPMPTPAHQMGSQMPVGEPPVIISGPGSAQ